MAKKRKQTNSDDAINTTPKTKECLGCGADIPKNGPDLCPVCIAENYEDFGADNNGCF